MKENQWIKFGDKQICFPSPDTLLDAIKKKQGITMLQLHDMGYRLLYSSLFDLMEKEIIFEDNGKYYTNN
jgi:hypothetical protein